MISAQLSKQKGVPSKRELQAQAPKQPKKHYDLDDDDFMAGMDMYAAAETKAKAKKAKRKAEHPIPVSLLNPVDTNLSVEGESRSIGDEIMKNRGLTRYRPKDKKNPRKRYRINYEKALIKRKSQGVKEYKGQTASYGGEASGIKSTVVRSRKL